MEVSQLPRFADRLMMDVAAANAWHESNDLGAQQDAQSHLEIESHRL